jgi:hypothetical protein
MALYSRFAVQRMSLIALDQGRGGKFVLQESRFLPGSSAT